MRTIKASRNRNRDYFCEITKYIDKWLDEQYASWIDKGYSSGTYFFYKAEHKENVRVFRFPGATRGHIQYNDNYVIERFIVYKNGDGVDCYVDGLEELLNARYIGVRLLFD